MRKLRSLLSLVLVIGFVVPSISFADIEPKALIQKTVDQLVVAVENNKGDEALASRRKEMRTAIAPLFNFEEMAKRSLGYHWKRINDEEREEYVSLFTELLGETYLKRLENIEEGMVQIKSQQIRAPKALVKTMVDYRGSLFPMDYKLLDRDGKWQVYDVVVENIGLVTNYRNEFSGIIRKYKFKGLLERLRDHKISSKV